jgi:hypothetical protein
MDKLRILIADDHDLMASTRLQILCTMRFDMGLLHILNGQGLLAHHEKLLRASFPAGPFVSPTELQVPISAFARAV